MRDDRIASILPASHMSYAEQLNAVVRFALYYGGALFVIRRSWGALYVPAVAAVATYIMYEAEVNQRVDRKEALDAMDLGDDSHTGLPCTRPTRDNPFMNVMPHDYLRNPNRPSACDLGVRSVARRAEELSSHNLYRDSDDVYGRRTSSRAFYTTPSTTIPNDQDAYLRWMYPIPRRTRKEGGN